MKTYLPKPEEIETGRGWYLVDAKGQTLGRLATVIAQLLMGKRKPAWAPHLDLGDYVVVINSKDVVLTGRKWDEKKYYSHSGYPGGLREHTARQVAEKHPGWLIWLAVKRMLPRNKLGRRMAKRLKVYPGPAHPHAAQNPKPIDVKEFF
ncbi:MAG: 50S ribosomal protein L13 [candidate division WOR-3 bacterium]